MAGGVSSIVVPRRLTPIGDRLNAWLRPLWFVALAFAAICDIGGTAYGVHEMYETRPVFSRIGLTINSLDYGTPVVGPVGEEAYGLGIVEDSRIIAVNGDPVPPGIGVEALTRKLRDASGPGITLRIASPEGEARDYRLTRSAIHARQADARETVPRDVQFVVRLGSGLLACGILLACATMLFLRRSRDPVAMLLSFGFLALAATIDPPLTAWLSLGFGDEYDFVSTTGWMLVLVALAAFPNGSFVPQWTRWIVPLALPLGIALSIDEVNETLQIVIGVLIPVVLVGFWWLRYRRLKTGIERQQIKWAAFGFVSGFLLVGIAVAAALNFGEENSSSMNLLIVTAFSIGFALIPLGLMISLIQFRLWEADVVITRSAAYAAVTVLVGVVWATSTDLVKELVNSTLGRNNTTVSAAISAVLAAGLFAPTQAVVLRWTKKRFAKSSSKLSAAAQRLPAWSATASPEELAARALEAIEDTVHARRGAVLAIAPKGHDLLASRAVDDPAMLASPNARLEEDRRFVLRLPLADDEGPVGTLLLGPRSDGNRYNRDEREALEAILEPLALAIRQSRTRILREEEGLQRMLGMVEERLRGIGGSGDPGPQTA